jgi:hypothetical protein
MPPQTSMSSSYRSTVTFVMRLNLLSLQMAWVFPGILLSLTMSSKKNHPEIPVKKKSDSPDEDKSIGDSRLLKPVKTNMA